MPDSVWDRIHDALEDRFEDLRDNPDSPSFEDWQNPNQSVEELEWPPIESEWDRLAEDRIARGLER